MFILRFLLDKSLVCKSCEARGALDVEIFSFSLTAYDASFKLKSIRHTEVPSFYCGP
jgi:hypothetical protein